MIRTKELKEYDFVYQHDNIDWVITIWAYDLEDAKERIKKISILAKPIDLNKNGTSIPIWAIEWLPKWLIDIIWKVK